MSSGVRNVSSMSSSSLSLAAWSWSTALCNKHQHSSVALPTFNITLWGKQTAPFYFLNNFVKSRSILIIFGAQIPEWICNKTVTKLSTSPNECHYTTLWNTTCQTVHNPSNAGILNVMTNWQLRTNTSQQMIKVFAFGFGTRIKTISPLINCLISDALLDSRYNICWFQPT